MSQLNKFIPNPLNNNPLPQSNFNYLKDIQGFIRTIVQVTITTPTFTPKNLSQQFEIRMNNTTPPTAKVLFIYSFETKIWSYITLV